MEKKQTHPQPRELARKLNKDESAARMDVDALHATVLFTTLVANLLHQAVAQLTVEIESVDHAGEHDHFTHGAKLASRRGVVAGRFPAAKNLTTSAGIAVPAAFSIALLLALVDLHAQSIDDPTAVGAKSLSFAPSVFSHQARGESSLSRNT